MTSDNEYFDVERHGPLGILRLKPYQGVALSEISYAQSVLNAIQTFESESKTVLLVCAPRGNVGAERMDTFWEVARHTAPDEEMQWARFSHAENLPRQVMLLESGVVQLLRLLQNVSAFKIIAVEGQIDFDLLGLLLAFDVRFCSRSTVFENRILDRGVTPGFGVLWYLARLLGHTKSLNLVLTRRTLDAEEALQLGLVTHLTDDDGAADEATHYAKDLASRPPAFLKVLAKAASFVHCDFESYLQQVGAGFTRLPPT